MRNAIRQLALWAEVQSVDCEWAGMPIRARAYSLIWHIATRMGG